MNNDLILFSKIAEHLIYHSLHNGVSESNSIGIDNYEALADELNSTTLKPVSGKWSAHALECFFSRCRKKYGKTQLIESCDYHYTSQKIEGFLPNTVRRKSHAFSDTKPEIIRALTAKAQSQENEQCYDYWLKREKEELDHEFYDLKRKIKKFQSLERNREKRS